jgi:hypothetical protein
MLKRDTNLKLCLLNCRRRVKSISVNESLLRAGIVLSRRGVMEALRVLRRYTAATTSSWPAIPIVLVSSYSHAAVVGDAEN